MPANTTLPPDPGGRNRIVSIEPATVTVAPDYDVGGVLIEIVDSAGHGFATVLDIMPALDMVLRVGGSIAHRRGWEALP